MRILLLHPEDELEAGPWALQRWGRAIDLGTAGAASYARAEEKFGCAVTGLAEFRKDFREMRRVRELIGMGQGRLDDDYGLDWWELASIEVHQRFEVAFLMAELARTLGSDDEVYVSRPCFHADVLRLSLGARLHTLTASKQQKRGLRHYLRVAKKFPPAQLLEIFWDKTDPGYQFRGNFSGRPRLQSDEVVLLPTCYVNVSRTAIAYAESLPDTRFLLVTTRRSGWVENRPANVSAAWLRSYASVRVRSRKIEFQDLMRRWEHLRGELNSVPEFRTLSALGSFDEFPGLFARGLEIRDAWRNVFDSEPVQAVICADDSNPSTHIPLMLARHRGKPAIACHHGALDGRYMFKRSHADVLLAKGRMEQDYLVRQCGVPNQTVEIGAPILPKTPEQNSGSEKSLIVFFSEAYEVSGGRAGSFYQDVLPRLADLALAEGKKFIVKLHPSESLTERQALVQQILNDEQQRVTEVVGGPLKDEMRSTAWFGVTVMSTVAVECAARGIPCFLCAWLEAWPYGYDDQFARFGAGIRIERPADLRQIPEILRNYESDDRMRENCWSPIERTRLRSLLTAGRDFPAATEEQTLRPAKGF
jgi:hypothetical protein